MKINDKDIEDIKVTEDEITIIYKPSDPLPFEEDTYHLGKMKRTLKAIKNTNTIKYNMLLDIAKPYLREDKLKELGI